MQCFLIDADRKQEQDERLRNRVAEIRDLAYDAEDVIDSFILEVAHQGGFHGIIKRFTSIFTKPFHLHKIRAQIKAIQNKLEDISKSLPSYDIPSEAEGPSSSSSMQHRLRRTYSHVEEVDVVSLDGVTRYVLSQLLREDEDRPHVVVSIVGMGGIGKTTLAKRVYNHVDVKRRFDYLASAFISQQCKPRELFHDILIKVLSPSKEERELVDKLKENELIKRLFDVLKEKRYLVVLDDIWRIEDWNSIKSAFPRGEKGSKILFTTRNKDIALLADPCNSPLELPLLTDDKSWKLFSTKAFPEDMKESDGRSRELEILGKEMVKKCGGLPLAIVALGGLLATKNSRAQWEIVQRNIHAHLNKIQQQDYQYNAVNGILALSYNDLPYYLKPCFLYIGHYPEDWEFSKNELIRLWIAEGFIPPSLKSGRMLTEDVAEQFLEELIKRCLVQVCQIHIEIGVETCRMHDLLRDLCLRKAREENFLGIMDLSIEENVNFVDVTLTASMPRRIAIHPSKRYVHLRGERPNLRSLLLFQNEKLIEFHLSKCKSFKFLRVLKVVKKDMDKWIVSSEIGNLYHLRYLQLECYTGKIILPQSIGKLRSLHTLHIESRGLSISPNFLLKLERLRHILLIDFGILSSGLKLMCLPPGFTLKNIETLKYIQVYNMIEKNVVLSMMNIQRLGIIFERSKVVETFLNAVIQLHCLRSLEMRFIEDSTESHPNLEPLSQCHHLSTLFLHGKLEEDLHPRLHDHVLKYVPANITMLNLWGSKLMQDPMVVLEQLPHLRTLVLYFDAYKGTRLSCSANGFLQLDSLKIGFLSELREWTIEEGAMPRLRCLYLLQILKMRMFPEGLRYVTSLQEMKLYEMKRSLVERIQVIDGREGDDFSKVTHIPSIQIFRTRND